MKLINSTLKWGLLASLLIFVNVSEGRAQGSESRQKTVTVTETFLIEAEKAIVERDSLRRQNALKDEENAALREQNAALRGLVDIERMRSESLVKAVQERTIASDFDERIRKSLEDSNTDYKLRNEQLLRRAESAERQRWVFGVVGFGLGVLTNRR